MPGFRPGESEPWAAEMIPTSETIINVTKAIQLSLAPVFLLTGIAGLLSVMTGRLARIIDRGRAVTEGTVNLSEYREELTPELQSLERRRFFISVAITACTIAALLLCLLIVTLFLEVLLNAPLKWLIGALFASSTIALIVSLGFFLREVHLAARTIHIPVLKSK
jgi:hypothetical protein